jgi:chromosome segregation ATPase
VQKIILLIFSFVPFVDCICYALSSLWDFSGFLSTLQQPELLKLKEEMSRISAKIKKGKKELSKKREEQRRHADDIAGLKSGIQDLTAKMADLQEKGRNVGDELNLDGNDLEEYFRM